MHTAVLWAANHQSCKFLTDLGHTAIFKVDFDKYTTLEEKVERFKQFNSDLKSEPSGAKRLYMLFQLYEFLLPSSLPTKSNGEALASFHISHKMVVSRSRFSQLAAHLL